MSDANDNFGMIVIPTTVGVALEVIANMYGVGEERKKNLEAAGYDYDEVQQCVNELMPILLKHQST